ncbi:sulfate transporter [Gallibacterium salpingitidis]|uniref:Sulfate transporter n=1 Tax=Gallibacterium salpingitidis TaxID=505341 RepID=A0A1A7NP65_9PAST|nr:SulP family inorganic anion transporter [Gallibacterium salpingitidis]OBW91311.1 sulfate transporter [Gallibacterium salpingitidis]OBX06336.1 sulfate transporter [Gallibacterium salpingitidis]OBX09956.1 sulfate transporter [Gallibacterium salpingitidis]WKT00645.1 SulP family inorganic anion transporter [Gallibacterium salpingitidis]
MFAIQEAYKAGLLQKKYWLNNLVAGVIVGVVALPLAMAFAIASGVKPEQGIYTSIIAGLAVSLFGGSRLQIAGPTGAFIVVLSGITAQYGVEGLQIATLMAGLILFALGISKMGVIIKFIPAPVIVGFTAGIGVIIWVGQWRNFFGLPEISGQHFHQQVWQLLQVFPQLHLATTLLAIAALLLVLYAPKIKYLHRIPGPLVALIIITVIQQFAQFDGVKTIGSVFGGIPQGLPEFSIPRLEWNQMITLIGPAFTIAMLGAIESLLSAVVADGMAGTKHQSNQELVGQGIANILAPLFGGFAATGAIARTATNIRNGGNSPLAGIIHAITLIIILVVLAPLASNIPLAALAAILFVVAWNMSDVRRFLNMVKRAPRADVVILLITFFLTVFADLVIAVNIGVILATLYFLKRMASSVEVSPSSAREINAELNRQGENSALPDSALVFALEGPFFFGAVENFERALAGTNTDAKFLIIRLKWVPFIDMTGIQALEDVIRSLHRRNVLVMFSGANKRVDRELKKSGIIQLIGEEHYFAHFEQALEHVIELDKQDQANNNA